MNLTVYASDDAVYSAREIMERIAKEKQWKILANPEDSHATDFKVANRDGRVATYDVESDLLMWDDDPNETEYQLFGFDANCYLGVSLPKWIDSSDGVCGIWGDGDDGYRYLHIVL